MLKYVIVGDENMYLLSIFPFLQGINELHVVFILDIFLLGLLFYKVYKNKKLIFTKDIKFILILGWSIAYLITSFYSVDNELSFLGFLKFFTIPIFIVLIMQYEYTKEDRDKWFYAIGKIGAIMVIGCLFLVLVGKKDLIFYQNRLAGFFDYANSFAMFLLIGVISTGFKKDFKLLDFVVMSLLLTGIILTNSRSLMIITAVSYIAVLIFSKASKKVKLVNSGIMILVGVSVVLIVGAFGVSNRLSTTSGNASEWVLRLLYYKDALRMLSENIFGYGHMAWWYMQEGVQTGAYDAKYIHNGLLQVAIDAGVIPALLIVVIFVKAFFERKRSVRDKVLMVVILGHALIDFDMEFLAITIPLFMTLEFDKMIEIKNVVWDKVCIVLGIVIYSFFFLVTVLENMGAYDKANSLFSYSNNLSEQLIIETDYDRAIMLAEKLYDKNKYFIPSAEVLSEKEQAENNYDKAEEYELWILKNKKYTMKNYIEYVGFLEKAINYYYSINDFDKVKEFVGKLNEVPKMVNEVKETSDSLAYKIAHKPRLDIPEEITEYISSMNSFCERFA